MQSTKAAAKDEHDSVVGEGSARSMLRARFWPRPVVREIRAEELFRDWGLSRSSRLSRVDGGRQRVVHT